MFKKVLITFICVLIMGSSVGCNSGYYNEAFDGYKQYKTDVFANGITFTAALKGGREDEAFKQMSAVMQQINDDMSLSLPNSSLSLFNNAQSDGAEVEISFLTYKVVEQAINIYKETSGAFNIAVVDMSKAWNVDNEGIAKYGGLFPKENAPAPPLKQEIDALRAHTDMNQLSLRQADSRYYLKKNDGKIKIDLGAIAKGFAADECIRIAKEHSIESAFINISGNICMYGKWYKATTKTYEDWEIGVTAPRPRGSIYGSICAIRVATDATVVTSGDYERYYTYADKEYSLDVCHIIDSRKGLPLGVEYQAEDDTYYNSLDHVISATVIGENSARADAYATAVTVLGYNEGIAFLKEKGLKGIIFTKDKKMALVGVHGVQGLGNVSLTQTSNSALSGYKEYDLKEYF